jgi:mRNA interferase MazF
MAYEFGDVVLVPFPFTSQTASKKRPAVIVSNATYNRTRPDVIVIAITSQIHAAPTAEARVAGWQSAGLLKPSVVKPVFATLEQSLVIRQLGTLATKDRDAVHHLIGEILG